MATEHREMTYLYPGARIRWEDRRGLRFGAVESEVAGRLIVLDDDGHEHTLDPRAVRVFSLSQSRPVSE